MACVSRVFDTYGDIIEAACDAWRKLIAQPETIMSIGWREWAPDRSNLKDRFQ
jgi:hypothetical protein